MPAPAWLKGKIRATQAAHKSGLEDALAVQIKAAGFTPNYESFDGKPLRIPFTPTKVRHYTPDFPLHNGIIVESKGYFQSADRAEHLAVRQQHPDLDIRFVFARPHNKIGKKSSTTYAKWCELKGFKWAAVQIPRNWLQAPANKASLAAIRAIQEEGK